MCGSERQEVIGARPVHSHIGIEPRNYMILEGEYWISRVSNATLYVAFAHFEVDP